MRNQVEETTVSGDIEDFGMEQSFNPSIMMNTILKEDGSAYMSELAPKL